MARYAPGMAFARHSALGPGDPDHLLAAVPGGRTVLSSSLRYRTGDPPGRGGPIAAWMATGWSSHAALFSAGCRIWLVRHLRRAYQGSGDDAPLLGILQLTWRARVTCGTSELSGNAVSWATRVTDIGSLITAGAALAVAIGGYVQFVLRRSIYPCIEFEVDLVMLDRAAAGQQSIGEVTLTVRNVGPGVGFVENIQCRVRYRQAGESGLGRDGLEPGFAHSLAAGPRNMGSSQRDEPQRPPHAAKSTHILAGDAFAVVRGAPRNFIQPGVTQRYRKPLAFPRDTQLVHVWAAFEYYIDVGRITWFVRISSPSALSGDKLRTRYAEHST